MDADVEVVGIPKHAWIVWLVMGLLSAVVGRLREDSVLENGIRLVLLSHNTKLGAAKGAVLVDHSGTKLGSNARGAVGLPGGKTLIHGYTRPSNMPEQDAVVAITSVVAASSRAPASRTPRRRHPTGDIVR